MYQIDHLTTTQRHIKKLLKHQPLHRHALVGCVVNYYRGRHRSDIDAGQVTVAMNRLVAEGDVIDCNGTLHLTKYLEGG